MEQKESNSRKHFYVSLAKSAVRIVAGIFLITGDLVLAGFFLIAAEGLGIVEEL
tara:strand:+ start:64 stop:225 length:162 start_codon:yes stop_codon:yes gene_type:complete